MPPTTTPLRALRAAKLASRPVAVPRRYAGGAPHYNEPSGWLFSEPVRPPTCHLELELAEV
jgi:hypothetical protein